MKQLEPIDDETGIDAYPGFIGVTTDHHDLFTSPKYTILKSFDWDDFFSSHEDDEGKTYSLILSTGPTCIKVSHETTIAELFDQVPSIDVFYDTPENQGPGSASFHIFIESADSSYNNIVSDIEVIISAFKADSDV